MVAHPTGEMHSPVTVLMTSTGMLTLSMSYWTERDIGQIGLIE